MKLLKATYYLELVPTYFIKLIIMESLKKEGDNVLTLNQAQIVYLEHYLDGDVEQLKKYNAEFIRNSVIIEESLYTNEIEVNILFESLKSRLKNIIRFNLPELEESQKVVFAQEASTSTMDELLKNSEMVHYEDKLYGTFQNFSKFSKELFQQLEVFQKIFDDKAVKETESNIEDVKNALEGLSIIKQMPNVENVTLIDTICKAIRVRPCHLSYFIAPFFYKLFIDEIHKELPEKLKNRTPMLMHNIEVEKDDRKWSFSFIARSDDYSDPHFTHLHQYALKVEDLLFKLIKEEVLEHKKEPEEKQVKYWWYFKQDDGLYIQYEKDMNVASELHYQSYLKIDNDKTKKQIPLSWKTKYHSYKIEFSSPPNGTGFQVNEKTGKIRKIKRVIDGTDKLLGATKHWSKTLKLKPFMREFPACPSNWIQLENLNFKTSIFNTINVDLSCDEATVVKNAILATLPNAKLYQVERVQNLVAYQKYVQSKKFLEHKYDGEDIKIECSMLFHGTRSCNPYEIIESEEGFDMRFSNEGLWGKGVYFAENASYSHNYAHWLKNNNDMKQIFIAKVLVGNSVKLDANSSLIIPPKLPQSNQRYDSVEGFTKNTKVHIVYGNAKSYPAYLVTYKIEHQSAKLGSHAKTLKN